MLELLIVKRPGVERKRVSGMQCGRIFRLTGKSLKKTGLAPAAYVYSRRDGGLFEIEPGVRVIADTRRERIIRIPLRGPLTEEHTLRIEGAWCRRCWIVDQTGHSYDGYAHLLRYHIMQRA